MKTKIYKPILIVALSVLTLAVSAQNTKSIHLNKYSQSQLLASVESSHIISAVSDELNLQLMKLIELCKFNPRIDVLHYAEPNYSEALTVIISELEKDVKYRPEESLVNTNDAMMTLDEVTNELSKQLKYKPAESMVDTDNETSGVFSDLLTELSRDVKYIPGNIQ